MYSPYRIESKIASLNTAMGSIAAAAETMRMGSTKRVPNTAIGMPHVRNLRCHFSSIRESTLAFTTALSNESVVSSTTRMTRRKSAVGPPHAYAATEATTVRIAGNTKICMVDMIACSSALQHVPSSPNALQQFHGIVVCYTFDMKDMQRWTIVFKALSNLNRLKIVILLSTRRKMNVGDIAEALRISVTATSNHLIMLQKLGVLGVEGRDGHVFYSLNSRMPQDFTKTVRLFI